MGPCSKVYIPLKQDVPLPPNNNSSSLNSSKPNLLSSATSPTPSPNSNTSSVSNLPDLNGTVSDETDPKENQVHPELLSLPALSLRGTFKRAYGVLVKIVVRIGWDSLLKHRGKVFVMEEEYQVHRAMVEEKDKVHAMDKIVSGTESESQDPETGSLNGLETPDIPGTPKDSMIALAKPSISALDEGISPQSEEYEDASASRKEESDGRGSRAVSPQHALDQRSPSKVEGTDILNKLKEVSLKSESDQINLESNQDQDSDGKKWRL